MVVFTIYATLGIARPVSSFLGDLGWLTGFFIAGMVLTGTAVFAMSMPKKPGFREAGVVIAVVAVYTLVLVRMELAAERTHIIEYSLVGALFYLSLLESKVAGRTIVRPALTAVVLASLFGIGDEAIQYLMPSRVFDARDILFNTLAGLMAVLAVKMLRRNE